MSRTSPPHCRTARLPILLSLLLTPYLANAAEPPQTQVKPDGALQWIGARAQIGIGYDSLQKLRAELSGVLTESAHSAVMGSAWLAKRAGGLKLGYQYQPAEQKDASIRKLFGAIDQNNQGDRKLSLGGGLEGEHWFGTGYLSRALTGQREQSSTSTIAIGNVSGVENGRPYNDVVTTTTLTRIYERAYDWGVGAEIGRVFEAPGLTLAARLDREWGKESAAQNSLTLGAIKRFAGTPHSLSLQASAHSRSGPLEADRHDTRAMLMYRYDLGSTASYRPARQVKLTPVSVDRADSGATADTPADASAAAEPAKTETRLVKTTVTMTGDAFFSINSAVLTENAKKQLLDLVEALRKNGIEGAIRVVGHTCNLGSDAFNLKLSQRRAAAVRDFLTAATGMASDAIQTQGVGKANPKYPNTKASRDKNRRVDIEFISVLTREEVITLPPTAAQPKAPTKAVDPAKTTSIEWKSEVIEEEPTWVRRALRTLPGHKQYVDTYRYARTEQSTSSQREWVNRTPSAADDTASVMAGSSVLVAIMANDTDPDGDTLQIESVGTPQFGTVSIEGNAIRYAVPKSQAAGSDTFSYTVRDAKGAKSVAQVRVAISGYNQAPVAGSDSASVSLGASVLIPVLSNDSDPDGDALEIDSVSAPSAGTAVIENGAIRYAAAANAALGDVNFSYTVRDAKGAKTTASVRVTVTAKPNSSPLAMNDSYYIPYAQLRTPVPLDVLKNDSDPDGDALTITSFTQPTNSVGSISLRDNQLVLLATRIFATSTFTYTVSDGKGGTSTATVTLIDP